VHHRRCLWSEGELRPLINFNTASASFAARLINSSLGNLAFFSWDFFRLPISSCRTLLPPILSA
jgi:hypothetical protein